MLSTYPIRLLLAAMVSVVAICGVAVVALIVGFGNHHAAAVRPNRSPSTSLVAPLPAASVVAKAVAPTPSSRARPSGSPVRTAPGTVKPTAHYAPAYPPER
jgi:hypothetical protein